MLLPCMALQALFWFKAARAAAAALSAALLITALAALPTHIAAAQWQVPAALAAAAAALGLAWRKADAWVQQFRYIPYDHQEKD